VQKGRAYGIGNDLREIVDWVKEIEEICSCSPIVRLKTDKKIRNKQASFIFDNAFRAVLFQLEWAQAYSTYT